MSATDSANEVDIMFSGPEPFLHRYISALQSQGLAVRNAPLETRSAQPVTDAVQYWLHVGLDATGPLAHELGKKAIELGEVALIRKTALACWRPFKEKWQDKAPDMTLEIEDEPWL